MQYLADLFVQYGPIAIIIIFQPEFRALLEKIGKFGFLKQQIYRITDLRHCRLRIAFYLIYGLFQCKAVIENSENGSGDIGEA